MTTVREFIKSVSDAARRLKVSKAAVYRWISVDRIPGDKLVKLAALYKQDPKALIHLTGSEKTNQTRVIFKSRNVLATLLEVYKGHKTLEEALEETGHTRISLILIQRRWGDRLPTLYTTLEQLDQGRINLDEACERLNVTKCTIHGIRRKYGYRPGTLKIRKGGLPNPDVAGSAKAAALYYIAGHGSLKKSAEEYNIGEKTVKNAVNELSVLDLDGLKRLNRLVRVAYAKDLEENTGEYNNVKALAGDNDVSYLLSKVIIRKDKP